MIINYRHMKLSELIKTNKTIFTIKEIGDIAQITNPNYLRVLVSRMVKRGDLFRIRQGIYTYTLDYNKFELANKLKKPSYVSLQTILFDKSIIFQDYSSKITSVSKNTSQFKIQGTTYIYNKIKNEIISNPLGIVIKDRVCMAETERAVCDMIYLFKDYYFDNLSNINKDRLLEIAKIYNKRVLKEVEKLCLK